MVQGFVPPPWAKRIIVAGDAAYGSQKNMDGKPRTARRFTVYQNCPFPTPEDRLLFILTYLKTYALQVVHGRLFGMVQGKANQWIHVLLPALLAALRTLGDAPARSLPALAQRLGVSEAEAATVVAPREAPAPVVIGPAAASASPLVPMAHQQGCQFAINAVRRPVFGNADDPGAVLPQKRPKVFDVDRENDASLLARQLVDGGVGKSGEMKGLSYQIGNFVR